MEFLLLRTGSIDSRFTGFDRATGGRTHPPQIAERRRRPGYRPRYFLGRSGCRGHHFYTLRAVPTAFLPTETAWIIDEIKTTTLCRRKPSPRSSEPLTTGHRAWCMGHYAAQQSLPEMTVRLTYYQVDDELDSALSAALRSRSWMNFLHELLCSMLRGRSAGIAVEW